MRRVVVTGLGAVTPIEITLKNFGTVSKQVNAVLIK